MNTYTLIKRDGTRQEVPFLLKNGVEYVTEHFSRAELDTGHDPKPIYLEYGLIGIEEIRKITGPLKGNSGYRNDTKQEQLYNQYVAECKRKGIPVGNAVSKPGHSPHRTGAAFDLSIPKGYTPQSFAQLAQQVSVNIGIPKARVGWKKYLGQEFDHVDWVFLLYAPYTNVPNPDPVNWRPGVTW